MASCSVEMALNALRGSIGRVHLSANVFVAIGIVADAGGVAAPRESLVVVAIGRSGGSSGSCSEWRSGAVQRGSGRCVGVASIGGRKLRKRKRSEDGRCAMQKKELLQRLAALAVAELTECAIPVVEQHGGRGDSGAVEVCEHLARERIVKAGDVDVWWIGSGHGARVAG